MSAFFIVEEKLLRIKNKQALRGLIAPSTKLLTLQESIAFNRLVVRYFKGDLGFGNFVIAPYIDL